MSENVSIEDLSRESEKALRRSQAESELARRVSRAGIWEWDVATGGAVFDERTAELIRASGPRTDSNLAEVARAAHPHDVLEIWRRTRECLDGKTDYLEVEYRSIEDGNGLAWRRDCGRVLERDEQGNPVSILHAIVDSTDAHRLKRLTRALERCPCGVLLCDGPHIADANPAALHMIGAASVEEIRGKAALDLAHPADFDEFQQFIGSAFQAGQQGAACSLALLRLDGAVEPVEVSCFVYGDSDPPEIHVFLQAARSESDQEFVL